ncbi:unnamed protein product [Schistosoma haematobium]|nr:unnamed protein product [Schistosoma haematobium]CAH8476660.1 unnamed protein product [Schistosoma haematobium]
MTLDKPIAVVKYVDMPVDMQQDAVDLCYQGIENFKEEYEIAKYLKKEYECKYGSIWHCIVGKSFGSDISLQRVLKGKSNNRIGGVHIDNKIKCD